MFGASNRPEFFFYHARKPWTFWPFSWLHAFCDHNTILIGSIGIGGNVAWVQPMDCRHCSKHRQYCRRDDKFRYGLAVQVGMAGKIFQGEARKVGKSAEPCGKIRLCCCTAHLVADNWRLNCNSNGFSAHQSIYYSRADVCRKVCALSCRSGNYELGNYVGRFYV